MPYFAQHPPEWLNKLPLGDQWLKPALWLLAVTASVSMVVATTRKLQALGYLIAASIVGIERNGANIINPGPDEELQAGDHVLLLGNPTQLRAGEELLNGSMAR